MLSQPAPPMSLLSLPRDVLLHCVFSDLSPQGQLSARLCRQTCRALRHLLPEPTPSRIEGLPVLAARLGQGPLALGLVSLTCGVDRLPITRDAELLALAASEGGCLDVLEFLITRPLWDPMVATYGWQSRAARAGHRHILQWAVDCGRPLDPSAVALLACQGSVELMEWLEGVLHRQTPPTRLFEESTVKVAFTAAAGAGSVELLQWLRARGASREFDWMSACTEAASHGHVHVLEWAMEQDARLAEWALSSPACAAAYANQRATLEWLLSLGEPFAEPVCGSAAEGGHL
jgi:hypothetical protein